MGLFGRIGAVLGVGGARVELGLPQVVLFRGSKLEGHVVLQAGRVSQRARMVTADLYEYWITGHGKNRSYHQRRHARAVLAEYVPIDVNYRGEFDFTFTIPEDARCTRRREGWEVRCEAHIPWGVDARASGPLRVVPHAEILAVQRAARDRLELHPVDWNGSGPEVMYNFRAPSWLSHVLDGVAFRMSVDGDVLKGVMVLNKQERGLTGMLGALVGADRENLEFTIPRSDLLTKRGSPNPAGAMPMLLELLQRIGAPMPPSRLTEGTPE